MGTATQIKNGKWCCEWCKKEYDYKFEAEKCPCLQERK